MSGDGVIAARARRSDSAAIRELCPVAHRHGERVMLHYLCLDVSQKTTSICVVDGTGPDLWRGSCRSEPEGIFGVLAQHAGTDSRIGIETGPMTPWLVHALCERGLKVVSLDARHAHAVLKMQLQCTTWPYIVAASNA